MSALRLAWILVGVTVVGWVVLTRWQAGPRQLVDAMRPSRVGRLVLWLAWAWLGWHLLVR